MNDDFSTVLLALICLGMAAVLPAAGLLLLGMVGSPDQQWKLGLLALVGAFALLVPASHGYALSLLKGRRDEAE